MTGNFYNWWQAYLVSGWSLNYVTKNTTGWHTSSGPSTSDTWSPTLEVYGPGHYRTTSGHNAYTVLCGGEWFTSDFYTMHEADVQRPSIGRAGAPFYLGSNVMQSGTYSAQTIISSNGNGATELPTYTLTSGQQYASLVCGGSPCSTALYTATAPMPCASYLTTVVASYGGFKSDPLWMFNNTPGSIATMWVYGYGLPDASGWEVDYTYKVLDACGNPMSWVEVNESFTASEYLYPDPVAGWPLPGNGTWELGQWTNDSPNEGAHFAPGGDFVDHIWELNGVGVSPRPLPWGDNSLREDAASTVLGTTQWFKAGTVTNGAGVLIRSDRLTKYIDHGVAQ